MIAFSFIIGLAAGIGIAYLINILLSRKIENKKYRKIGSLVSYAVCLILAALFSTFSAADGITDTVLSRLLSNLEQSISKVSPGLVTKEYDTSEISSLVLELKKSIATAEQNEEYGFITQSFLQIITASLPQGIQSFGKNAELYLNTNNTVSINSLLRFAKDQSLKTIKPYWKIGSIITAVLFAAYLICYISVISYFKKGNKLYNNSIVFGEDSENPNT